MVFVDLGCLQSLSCQLKCSGAHLASSGGARVPTRWCLILCVRSAVWLLNFHIKSYAGAGCCRFHILYVDRKVFDVMLESCS